MDSTMSRPSPAAHLGRLESVVRQPAKADLKTLEMPDAWRIRLGHAVAVAFELAHLSSKEVAALIDRDPGQVSKWLSGVERPQFDLLFAIPQLQQPLVIALAALAQQGIEITTQITIRRVA